MSTTEGTTMTRNRHAFSRSLYGGDLRPYVITYKHNRTGALMYVTLWALSKKDARERFAQCEERQEAERIIDVEQDE
jgi:hypothetical protein